MYRRELTTEQKATLEGLIDSTSLSDVLEGLASIAYEKAEHVASNWQDTPLANAWTKAGHRLSQQAGNEYVREISL